MTVAPFALPTRAASIGTAFTPLFENTNSTSPGPIG